MKRSGRDGGERQLYVLGFVFTSAEGQAMPLTQSCLAGAFFGLPGQLAVAGPSLWGSAQVETPWRDGALWLFRNALPGVECAAPDTARANMLSFNWLFFLGGLLMRAGHQARLHRLNLSLQVRYRASSRVATTLTPELSLEGAPPPQTRRCYATSPSHVGSTRSVVLASLEPAQCCLYRPAASAPLPAKAEERQTCTGRALSDM